MLLIRGPCDLLSSLPKKVTVKLTQSTLILCNPKDYTVNVFQILAQISPQWRLPLSSPFILQTIHSICSVLTPCSSIQFSYRGVSIFTRPWTAAQQPSLSISNSQSLRKLMSIESVMPSKHFILCCPLLLLPSIFPSIRIFSNESVLCIKWLKCWSFSFSISPSNECSGLISFRMDWFDFHQSKEISRIFSNTIVQKHQFFGTWHSLWSNSHIHTWLLEKLLLWQDRPLLPK